MSNRKRVWWVAASVLVLVLALTQITLFVVPPIGAVPEGRTVVLLRLGRNDVGDFVRVKTRFIDSADGICEREMGGVSLLCRGMVMATVVGGGTILLRLPYSETLRRLAE